MKLPTMNLEVLRTIPLMQKVAFVVLVLAGIIVMFYYYVVEPKSMEIANLQGEIGRLDTEIQTLTIKVKHLDELIAAISAVKQSITPPRSGAEFVIDHLGIAVGSLDEALAFWEKQLGMTVSLRETVSAERVNVAMLPASSLANTDIGVLRSWS